MAPVVKTPTKSNKKSRPRVLVVDDERSLVDTVKDIVGPSLSVEILSASNLKQARKLIANESIELLVTDVKLPDGDGLQLLNDLKSKQPHARAIVITGEASTENTLTAFRGGALDLLPKPFNSDQLVNGVKDALLKQSIIARHEVRLNRLTSAVKKLSEARKMVSKKVDLLCNDLVSAYSELTKQLDGVRTQEGFRKYIAGAKDLEQLLCHAMDWLLRQLGYSNIALWLASSDSDDFQLGAYMKYTIPGEPIITEALKRDVLPRVLRDNLVRIAPDEMAEKLTESELEILGGQEFIGVSCTYLGEPLAALIFFRDSAESFSDEDATTLQQISSIFAVELATAVKEPAAPSDDLFGSEGGPREEEDRHDADWWKRGDRAPF